MKEVAIVGGGIAGLAAAFFLGRAGVRTTVYESSEAFGGLGGTFEYQGVSLERFYHCMLPSDHDLLGLLDAIGIRDRVYWKETSFGVHAGGVVYPLNKPSDLIGFKALSVSDRLRLGLTGLYARMASSDGLDRISCEDWLLRISGRRAFDVLWKPMLEAKFGSHYRQVPALWFWSRLHREKSGPVERKGYIRGGYGFITDRLVDYLKQQGHSLNLRSPVTDLRLVDDGRPRIRIEGNAPRTFDRAIFAGPLAALQRIVADGNLAEHAGRVGQEVDMVGVLNVLLLLERRLSRHYWIAITGENATFQGVVETTNLIGAEDSGGWHILHLVRYLHRTDPLFSLSDEQILEAYIPDLRSLFPQLGESDIVERFVFRTPFVEPVYSLGYLEKKPPTVLIPGRLFLVTSTQVYPGITSWNGSVGLARRLVEGMLQDKIS